MNTNNPSFALNDVGQIGLTVSDLEKAVTFYRDALGMKHLFNAPPKMAFFDCDGIRLMLGTPERPDLDHPSSILYFKVDDIDAAYEPGDALKQKLVNEITNWGRFIDGHGIKPE